MMGKVFFIRMGKMIETSENTGVQLNKDINFALNLSEVGQGLGVVFVSGLTVRSLFVYSPVASTQETVHLLIYTHTCHTHLIPSIQWTVPNNGPNTQEVTVKGAGFGISIHIYHITYHITNTWKFQWKTLKFENEK